MRINWLGEISRSRSRTGYGPLIPLGSVPVRPTILCTPNPPQDRCVTSPSGQVVATSHIFDLRPLT